MLMFQRINKSKWKNTVGIAAVLTLMSVIPLYSQEAKADIANTLTPNEYYPGEMIYCFSLDLASLIDSVRLPVNGTATAHSKDGEEIDGCHIKEVYFSVEEYTSAPIISISFYRPNGKYMSSEKQIIVRGTVYVHDRIIPAYLFLYPFIKIKGVKRK